MLCVPKGDKANERNRPRTASCSITRTCYYFNSRYLVVGREREDSLLSVYILAPQPPYNGSIEDWRPVWKYYSSKLVGRPQTSNSIMLTFSISVVTSGTRVVRLSGVPVVDRNPYLETGIEPWTRVRETEPPKITQLLSSQSGSSIEGSTMNRRTGDRTTNSGL